MERTRTFRTIAVIVVIVVVIGLLMAAGPSLLETIIRLHSR